MDMSKVEGGSILPFLVATTTPLSITAAGFIFLSRHKQQKQQLDLSNDVETVKDGSNKETGWVDGEEEEESRSRIEKEESRQRTEEEESVQRIEERESRKWIKEK